LSRYWRSPDGNYLIQGAPVPWPISGIGTVRLSDGRELDHATMYSVVEPSGRVTATYPAPRAYSLEDSLYLHDFYEVVDGQFCRLLWEQRYRGDAKVLHESISIQAVILTDLVECGASELPFDPDRLPPAEE
jgi:hypothetical protein